MKILAPKMCDSYIHETAIVEDKEEGNEQDVSRLFASMLESSKSRQQKNQFK